MSKLINIHKKKFLNYGVLSYKKLVLKAKCNSLRKKIKLPRPLSRIFVSESMYKKNPQVRKTVKQAPV